MNPLRVVASLIAASLVAVLLVLPGGKKPAPGELANTRPLLRDSHAAVAVGETALASGYVEAANWNELLRQAEAAVARALSASSRISGGIGSGNGRCATGDWDCLAQCESGGNWSTNTGNGYEGGIQFSPSTWAANKPEGAPENAADASREQQIAAGESTLASQGRNAWPSC